MSQAPEAFLRGLPLAQRLDDGELESLARMLEPQCFEAGATVLSEGQASDRLYFIDAGSLDVVKQGARGDAPFVIGQMSSGQLFGDLSFLDERPCSATVKARETTRTWSLSRRDVARPEAAALYAELLRWLAATSAARLRTQTDSAVRALEGQLEEMRRRNEAGHFLVLVFVIFGIQSFSSVLGRHFDVDTDALAYRWGMLLLFSTPTILFARRQGYAWETLGLTWRGARRALFESLLLAVPLLASCIAVRWAALELGALAPGSRLFTPEALTPFKLVDYFFHAALQELCSRGVFQGAMLRFIGPDKGRRVVLVVSVGFAVLHLHLGAAVAAATLAGSLLFGFVYLRHQTLVGVVLLHYVLGVVMHLLGVL